MTAAQCLGGVPVPLYQDAVASEMEFVLDHAEMRFAVAEDQEQVDKLLAVRERLPRLEHIIYDDPRGLRHYDQTALHRLRRGAGEGARLRRARIPDFFDARDRQGQRRRRRRSSSTPRAPPASPRACADLRHVIARRASGVAFDGLSEDDEVLAYLPMAWVGDHLFSYAQSYCRGLLRQLPGIAATR